VGWHYLCGLGVEKNLPVAIMYIKKSAALEGQRSGELCAEGPLGTVRGGEADADKEAREASSNSSILDADRAQI
jgi:TPR repeat protein